MEFLLEHFKLVLVAQGCDIEAAKREWSEIKLYVSTQPRLQAMSYVDFWQRIFTRKQKRYPNILHIVAIILVYPISNAELERAFSALKRVVTDWRTSLATNTIDDLLLIQQEGPPVADFNAERAVKRWLASSNSTRRLCQRKRKLRQPQGTGEGGDSDSSSSIDEMDVEGEATVAEEEDDQEPEEEMEVEIENNDLIVDDIDNDDDDIIIIHDL